MDTESSSDELLRIHWREKERRAEDSLQYGRKNNNKIAESSNKAFNPSIEYGTLKFSRQVEWTCGNQHECPGQTIKLVVDQKTSGYFLHPGSKNPNQKEIGCTPKAVVVIVIQTITSKKVIKLVGCRVPNVSMQERCFSRYLNIFLHRKFLPTEFIKRTYHCF